ncbi:MAG: ABC transporter substrate-binding protein [Burkholderiales bacterium]|jgi:iron(III) transport system substrate-binding protein|nr:ABC transporter substrate-binding protein [Burkholderiales bacterium]
MRAASALVAAFLAAGALAAPPAAAQRSLAVYCSHDADACELAAKTYSRETGVDVAITRKPTGEAYAQVRAERDNPRADVWYGGTIDPLLQAATEGLLEVYRSPRLADLAPWAREATERSGFRVAAIYRIVIGFGMNPALLSKQRVEAPRCWSDLTAAALSNDVELSNPVTSGTGYTILATLVTLYGEDGAFDYLRRLAPNVVRYTQSGTAQGPSVARGEVAVGVSFVHEFVTQQLAGFAVDIAIPCEGTGAALGGMAIVAGAPHPREARLFYDWALGRDAQELANHTRNLIVPANSSATVRPEAARFANVPTLDVDPMRFSQPELRKRLLARWQREIGDAAAKR